MVTYIANPNDATRPLDTDPAQSMASEFRALKGKINTYLSPAPVWNVLDQSPSLVITNGSLIALKTDATSIVVDAVRGTSSVTGPGYYAYETTVGAVTGLMYIGAATLLELDKFPAGGYPGNSVYSAAYCSNGNIYYNGALVGAGAAYITNDIVGIAFNASTGVNFYKNGALQGTSAWNAAVQTVPKYPFIGLSNYGDYGTSNFGAANFTYAYGNGAIPFYQPVYQLSGRQNILINGQMQYDQRFAKAVHNPAVVSDYIADRWRYIATVANKHSSQVFATTLAEQVQTGGAVGYLRVSCTATYAFAAAEVFYFGQPVEGLRQAKLLYGNAAALTSTLLFSVRTSVAGTYTGSIFNFAGTRSYPFSFVVPVAATFTRIAVVVPGCVDGAWAIDNSAGMTVMIGLGIGSTFSLGTFTGQWQVGIYQGVAGVSNIMTNGVTIDTTGFELKVGIYTVTAPSEGYAPIEEMLLCQRYYFVHKYVLKGFTNIGANIATSFSVPAPMRTSAPTATVTGAAYTNASTLTGNMLDTNGVWFNAVGGAAAANFSIQATVAFDCEL